MLSQERLSRLRESLSRISVEEARRKQKAGVKLIDVREDEETAKGSPVGAARISRSFLELQIENVAPDADAELMVLCASGARSLFAADDLKRLGYSSVHSVDGGFQAWEAAGLPVEKHRQLSAAEKERYARHLRIPEVGAGGQARLLSKKVALVGAGGLGSPVALYLAAAGIGTLGLIDNDRLERSNLQRQILHTDDRVGELKISSAAKSLQAFNPDIALNLNETRLNEDNAQEILGDYDMVIDGSDNLATRYVVSDASTQLNIPMIYGAISRFEGQVSAFWPNGPSRGPCYRCLFPEKPPASLTPSCAEAGVLGVLPGVIGTIMATEAIKILLAIGEPLIGRLLIYNALDCSFRNLEIAANPHCNQCQSTGDLPRLRVGS
ncbi:MULTISPECIES: molybdopterin-synthase adenylyltransferase MoeB [Rhizobium]|uniref:Molybdopterin-synthase adenylyltransferase n=1 Tax=Rhizobium leguminosarum TaxID=384 RepID=A0A2Z4YT41_RHILE|nr:MULTISPECIES: molybdopterin-synthase adenylyltransferase MoeB [Rhizobium]AXA43545.1 ThiF family protein [Rhizobium leguminosarum]MBA9036752.1 molybdopterin/thiamine biosynthesis adenylyltransferase [Rhizobium leguminosarum]